MTLTIERTKKKREERRRVPYFELPPSMFSQEDKERRLTNDEIIDLVSSLKEQWDAASIRAGLRKGARNAGARTKI